MHEDKQFCKFEIREIPDPDIRRKCEEIEGTSEEKDFRGKVLDLEERFDVGFNKASVSFGDKEKLLQTIAYHYVINTCHDEILQFKEGLSFGGVLDVLKRFPLEAFKELTDSKEAIITSEDFEGVFEANLSIQGSNLRMGLEHQVQIEFEHEPQAGKRVTANTCGPVLTFPVSPRYSCDLETFCKNLAEDIISSPGFGFV